MGIKPIPMYPKPGSPAWMYEEHWHLLYKEQRSIVIRSMIVIAATIFSMSFIFGLVLFRN